MKIIKNSPIINSAIKAWNGEEKLWKVFWLWGVLLYVSSFCVLSFSAMFAWKSLGHGKLDNLNILMIIFTLFYSIFIFLYAFTLAFIYPIIFLIALNRCCHNKASKVAIKLFSIFAIYGHLLIAMLYVMTMVFYLCSTSESAYLVVKKITDYICNKTTENIVHNEIYVPLTGLIYLIILCYLISTLIKFLNQNTKLASNKLSFKKVFMLALFTIIMVYCFLNMHSSRN